MNTFYNWMLPGTASTGGRRRAGLPQEVLQDTQFVAADNIFGPRVEDVWIIDELSDDAHKYIARHTLAGEITPSDPNMPSKFHVFPELVFSARHQTAVSRYSLSLVVHRRHMSRYLALHDLVEDRLLHVTSQLMVLLNQPGNINMESFHGLLPSFTSKLNALFQAVLPTPNFKGTFFNSDVYSREFLEKAITSHLQTHCCTIVSGSDLDSVNAFIDSLSLFLTPEERMRSSYARPDRVEYVPDLFLQGFVNGTIDDESLIQSRFPTTYVNLVAHHVSQTRPYHEYTLLRNGYLKADVEKLVDYSTAPEIWTEHDRLLRTVEHSSPAVCELLTIVYKLPFCLREGHLRDTMRQLTRRAVVLVKYLEVSDHHRITDTSVLKKMRADLGLVSNDDYQVLLALAEKIAPGSYLDLAGDPMHMEEKFVQLFESF